MGGSASVEAVNAERIGVGAGHASFAGDADLRRLLEQIEGAARDNHLLVVTCATRAFALLRGWWIERFSRRSVNAP